MKRLVCIGTALVWLYPSAGAAQVSEVEIDKSATRELYVRRRPPIPETPKIPSELQKLMLKKEKLADKKRKEAIGLLREFLGTNPTGKGEAEGLFKLAELLWEDGRREYVRALDRYERQVEACRQRTSSCKGTPKEPTMSLAEPEALYKQILEKHSDFDRTDLVLYLVGFATREDGRIGESLGYFQRVIQDHPQSPLYGDAWMMVAEHYFADGQWELAREAFNEILQRPSSQAFDMALFKSAWCDWKLGDTDSAARKFKKVLDLAREARRTGSNEERKRREQLRDEALDYLVLVFTEDPNIRAKDVYAFLAGIGGEEYSGAVLTRLADLFHTQADYERAVEAYKFLIELQPKSIKAAKYQRRIVDAWLEALEGNKAMAEIKILVNDYGRKSAWAKANSGQKASVTKVVEGTEKLVRTIAKNFHGEAQAMEKQRGQPNLELYKRAASTYSYYLGPFGKHENAVEIRFLRAEILLFKLQKNEEAGDEYLKVGKSAPVGKWHEQALIKAMEAFKRARPKGVNTVGKRELLPVDRKFAEATDLYATLFPAGEETVRIIYENGMLFFNYGDYDEAIKRFGVIVTKYPKNKNAGAAGDRLLEALNKAKDYENIETWARKLKKAKGFGSKDQTARLNRLIVESIGKSGEKYAAAGKYEKAAGFYMRIPKEFPSHKLAAQAYFNAAVMLEKAKKPEEAAATYLAMSEEYADNSGELSRKAAFTAAQVYESVAYFERAAEAYEVVAKRFPRTSKGGDALFNAGVLRQALGQPKKAIKHYEKYAKRFRKTAKKDAQEVAFRIGVVYEAAGDDGRAQRAYQSYIKRYSSGSHVVEAMVRSGRTSFKLGRISRARKQFKAALAKFKRKKGADQKAARKWAAEARYYQGEEIYLSYKKVSLDVKPRKLSRAMDKKTRLLTKASDVYFDVASYGDPQWSTAALYRVGSVVEEFANKLRDAPAPPGLSAEEKEMYKEQLDPYVIDIEEKAIVAYKSGYLKAIEMKIYNGYTKKLRDALGRMAPSEFPPTKESRTSQRLGDRAPTPKLVEEVIRGE